MSIPMNHEDLNKLRLFVEYCCKNPTILNTAPLKFVKEFIENFGGKVPVGDFQPAEGKCPFGGSSGVKSEPAAEHPLEDSDAEEVEISDPESELELDNEAICGKGARIKKEFVSISPTKKQIGRKLLQKRFKTVCSSDDSYSPNESDESDDSEDPLAIKGEEILEHESSTTIKRRRTIAKTKTALNQSVDSSNLSDQKPNTRKYTPRRKRNPRLKICSRNCKHECGFNFNTKRRKQICDEYWSLSPAERGDFIRDSTETRKIKRICVRKTDRPPRGFMTRYFLREASGEKRRVCVLFYLSTLCITFQTVKQEVSAAFNAKTTESLVDKKPLEETPKKPIPKQVHSNKGKKLNMTREPRPVDCDVRCRTKCTQKISEEQRAQICAAFWAMDFKRRKDYVVSRIETHETITKIAAEFRKSDRPRGHHNYYFLRNQSGENVRVCLKFFTATLCLSFNYIRETLRRTDRKTGTYVGDDMRGRKAPANKISDETRENVKRHIESYPTWAPQKRSKMRYLHSTLNVQKMYKEYKQKCIDSGRKFVNPTYFRRVFHEEFRLAFLHAPSTSNVQKIGNAKRIEDGQPAPKKRKVNRNISEYTGEEGGFWINTAVDNVQPSVVAMTTIPAQNVPCYSQTYATMEPIYTNYVHCPETQNEQQLLTDYVERRFENAPTVTQLY